MAETHKRSEILNLIGSHSDVLLKQWLAAQKRDAGGAMDRGGDNTAMSARFLTELQSLSESAPTDDPSAAGWESVHHLLEDFSRDRVLAGYSPSETASFVLSLKEPLFKLLNKEFGRLPDRLGDELWNATLLLDRLGLYTIECYQKTREDVIRRQQQELLELSTPVVELWDGILALPLIGTLDSVRTQTVMESLLERIVSSGAELAIIDITGVPTVDTLVAQHLIKTISAARLMGADCILSGIRPQIAQTIVHLGLDLNVVSKATMADALELALRRLGKTVTDRQKPAGQEL